MVRVDAIDANRVRAMIHQALRQAPDGRAVHRLDAALLVAEGRSCREVATIFGVDRRTVERWVRAARSGRVDLLQRIGRGGRRPTLDDRQKSLVQTILLTNPVSLGYPEHQWTGKRLAAHLMRAHAISLGVRSCQRLIKAHRAGRTDGARHSP